MTVARRPFFWGGADYGMKVEIREVRESDREEVESFAGEWTRSDKVLVALNLGIILGAAIKHHNGVVEVCMKEHYKFRGIEEKLKRAVAR